MPTPPFSNVFPSRVRARRAVGTAPLSNFRIIRFQKQSNFWRLHCFLPGYLHSRREKIHLLAGIRGSSASLHISDKALKRFLSIFSDRIFDSSVERGIPNLTAAPLGPDTRPRVSFSAASIISFSCTRSLTGSSTCCFDSGVTGDGNQFSSIEKISVSQSITERSMT